MVKQSAQGCQVGKTIGHLAYQLFDLYNSTAESRGKKDQSCWKRT
jgi:hypothetical protein